MRLKLRRRLFFVGMANAVLAIHLCVIAILIFGLFTYKWFWLYTVTLIGTLGFELATGYCPLTRAEFWFRKKAQPEITVGDTFLSYYAYKMLPAHPTSNQVRSAALLFLLASLFLLLCRLQWMA